MDTKLEHKNSGPKDSRISWIPIFTNAIMFYSVCFQIFGLSEFLKDLLLVVMLGIPQHPVREIRMNTRPVSLQEKNKDFWLSL